MLSRASDHGVLSYKPEVVIVFNGIVDGLIEISFICDPCMTLKHLDYFGSEKVKEFIKTLVNRRGWYARVLKPGYISKGDAIRNILI